MAKSRLSASRNQNKPITQLKTKENVTSLDFTVELYIRGKPFSAKFNLIDWCHEQCDPQKPLVNPSRLMRIQKLKEWIDLEKKNQSSYATLSNKLTALRQYISFCDFKKLDPFCQAGYLSYAGNTGQLQRLVKAAIEPKKYQFQYFDGEELGLLERSAFNLKVTVDSMLQLLDFDVSYYQAKIQPFSKKTIRSSTKPYTSGEWYVLVRRTQLFFFSLATQLIAFKAENPEAQLPESFENIVVDKENDRDIAITMDNGDVRNGAGSLFNQCMGAAYTLFAYYTAFNDTVIQDIRHPIKVMTSKIEGRTSKIAQVRAYKGRAAKDVQALFSASEENLHPEASDINAGFIVADINKRDTVGNADGITFLETLRLLSKAYSDDPYGTLIYFLDREGKRKKIDIDKSLQALSQNLNLLSDCRGELTEHLVRTYTDIVENKKMTAFNWIKREDGSRIMNKQVIKLDLKTRSKRATPIAFAALSCMTNISLRNALLPLTYSKKDENGAITVSFKYVDGSEGKFIVAAKYRPFLQLVERYAATKNQLPRIVRFGNARTRTRLPFLLPLGKPSETYQWQEGKVPISLRMLSYCGIGYGDYFLNITSSRIRVTHSDLEYKPEERGLTAQLILQHSINTADKRYRNGHPVSNNKQISQSMMALMHIAQGKTRNEAVELVKQELKIPVLEYDIWKNRNQPTNPNGVICDGKINLASEKDWHYAARKFAENKGIIAKGQDITCFQYDLCIFCKSAKLVDDPYAIYKLLSFLDALGEGIDQYPERASVIQLKIERFQAHLDDIPLETMKQAEDLLEEKGRYPLFDSLSSVAQFL